MNKDLFARLLDYYQIDENTYQQLIAPVSADSFAIGHNFKHIQEAIDLVNDVMDHHGKIFIYGDYDADGIMGTSILVKMFSYKNYPVDYYIPSRYIDGYGLTLLKAQECVKNNVELVICVDNGVAAFEPIEYLKASGIKVLVLDHHEIQESIPQADVILHPTFDYFGGVPSSGAFTAFNFSRVFLGRFDKYLSTLAAISLISDMMPLVEYNRELLRIVFENYQEHEFLQIDLLKDDEPFNETTIGMKIAPKINSIGRVLTDTSVNLLVKFFVSNNKDEILHYIDWINDTNENRKSLSRNIDDDSLVVDETTKAIVLISEAKEGILGLIANNLLNKYHLPVVVVAKDEEKGFYKGSARAPEGFSIVEAFKYCESQTIVAGGHASAGGCTIGLEQFDTFKKMFIEYANSHPVEVTEKKTIELGITELNLDNYKLVQTFSPFGESWPSPLFSLKHISTRSLFFSKNREHILTQLGPRSKIVGFNFPMDEVKSTQFIDLEGNLRTSTFNNITSVEFFVKKIKHL